MVNPFFQRKLDGYKFPVYSTKQCPRNKTEWNQRSSAINCTKDNGYVCLPNENITELLEFCYTYTFILIQEGSHMVHKVSYRMYTIRYCFKKLQMNLKNAMARHLCMNFEHIDYPKIIHQYRSVHFFLQT